MFATTCWFESDVKKIGEIYYTTITLKVKTWVSYPSLSVTDIGYVPVGVVGSVAMLMIFPAYVISPVGVDVANETLVVNVWRRSGSIIYGKVYAVL